ncbi:MAG: Eco57I restriction-modification methylase domain-containing protein [Deltaproteobacteria bacterium]|nr:Eco57I restriction-modification methylase domain-containing protein [Deltaproteobacteria bacterium]
MRGEIKRLSTHYRFFHWHLAFPDVFHITSNNGKPSSGREGWSGGFNLVLGNPPWIRQEKLKPIKNLLSNMESYKSTADISVYFLDLSLNLIEISGYIGLLTPNKWLRASYAELLRHKIKKESKIVLLVDFGHSKTLFPGADTFPVAISTKNIEMLLSEDKTFKFVRAYDEDRKKHTISALIKNYYIKVPYRNLCPELWKLQDISLTTLLDKLSNTGPTLGEYLRCKKIRGILTGIKSGRNEAFYIDSQTRNRILNQTPGSSFLIKPLLRGRDIKRWITIWEQQWHILIPSSQNKNWPWSNASNEFEAEAIFNDFHPAIHEHLVKLVQSK